MNREDLWSKFMTTETAITLTDKLTLAQGRKNMIITEYNTAVQTLNKYQQELGICQYIKVQIIVNKLF